ncbi:MAG: hypothetical protein GSR80_000836 [Desulfurococcales archaeon]|nr:hypothetical protein [Desulfurococcales archaeon]
MARAVARGEEAPVGPRAGLGLSEREAYLMGLILELRGRGLGTYRIGRILWPSLNPRTAQKRVQRILGRARRLGLPVEDPRLALSLLRAAGLIGRPVETPASKNVETTRRRAPGGEDGSVWIPGWQRSRGTPRLGPTQRLAVAALASLGGRARFSAIVNEVLGLLGVEGHLVPRSRLRNRVWQALRRLAARGLVGRYRGVYWLAPRLGSSGVLVENFRARTHSGRVIQVWSKREAGRAATLEEALTLATLRGAVETVQVELSVILRDPGLEEVMDALGVSIIKVYRDPAPPYNLHAKAEATLSNPPLKPGIEEHHHWARALHTITHALRKALATP